MFNTRMRGHPFFMEQIEEMLSVARLNDLLKRPFSDNVRSSVETVLEAHFDPANRYETTGSLVEKEGRLNFDIVRPVYSTNLLSAIDKIVSGDDFTADEKMELSLSMETAREQVSRHYKERTKGSSDSFGKISNDANIMTRSIQLDVAQKIYHNIAVDLKKRLDHANNKLVTLFAGGKIIASYDNLTDISQHIIEVINRVIPVNKALFLTASSTSQKLTVRHSFGYKNLPINTYLNINKDPLLGKLYLEPKTKIFYKHDWTKEYNELPYVANSLIVAPIILTKKAIGFIILGDKNNGRDFSMNNQILLDAIATQIAPALEEQRLSNLKASADDLKRVYIEPFA